MDPLIIDKSSAQLLAELATGSVATKKRHSDVLWSLILHDGCMVPPFFDDHIYQMLCPLEEAGLLEFQSRDNWDSFQTSLNPVLSEAVEYDEACTLRYRPQYDITLDETPDHANQWQVYGMGLGDISDRARDADSFLTKNVAGLEPLLKEFARTWNCPVSKQRISLFCNLHVPIFAHTLRMASHDTLDNPNLLSDWNSWFGQASGDAMSDFISHNFDVFSDSGITSLDEANNLFKDHYNSSFKYFCRKNRFSIPKEWKPWGEGQKQFERALKEYLYHVAESVADDTYDFVTFWDLVYKTMYLLSEAQFNGASLCADSGKAQQSSLANTDTPDDSLRVVRLIHKHDMCFPRLRSLDDARRLLDDTHFGSLRQRIWEWKREFFAGDGNNVDALGERISRDLKTFGKLPAIRKESGMLNVLAMTATMVDALLGTCLSVGFVPLGIYYHKETKRLERQTEWCLVGRT